MTINTQTSIIAGGLQAAFPDAWLMAGSPEAVTPLGSSQATGAPLASTGKALSVVTGADGTLAVVLPAIQKAGQTQLVYSATATSGLPVYPASGGTINGGSGDAAVTIEGKSLAIFVATSTTNWAAIFTVNT